MGEFMMEVLNVVAIIVSGLMVGCELAIAGFIHPTLDTLPIIVSGLMVGCELVVLK